MQALPADTGAPVALVRPALVPARPAVAPWARGFAFYYYPHRMRSVARVRGMISIMRWDLDGFAAFRPCGTIGRTWDITIAGRALEVQQLDCWRYEDYAHQTAIGDVVEVNYALAAQFPGFVAAGRIPATVWGLAPAGGR